MNKEPLFTAHCDCGQQSIAISAPSVAQLICHCQDCQQACHRLYAPIAFFQPQDCEPYGEFTSATMLGGSGQNKTYFNCPHCQSCVYATIDVLRGMIAVVADRISAPFIFKPTFHVWTSEQHIDSAICDDTLQFSKGPPKPPHMM